MSFTLNIGNVAPRRALAFPTRNFALNAWIDGGFPFNGLTVISGEPNMFKSTIVAEAIADAQAMNYWQVVFDRENKLTAERLSHVGANGQHPRMVYFNNSPYLITIEEVFTKTTEAVAAIRSQECEEVVAGLENKDAALVERYRRHLNAPASYTPARIAGLLHKGEDYFWHLLHEDDTVPILWVVDSITSTPSLSQVAGDKIETKDRDRMELQVRGTDAGSNSLGQSARAWSDSFKCMKFMGPRVIGLATSQMRLSGFGTYTGPKSTAAHSKAVDFAANLHIQVKPDGGKDSFVMRTKDGLVHFGASPPAANDVFSLVGRRVILQVKKLASSQARAIPAFMLNRTGTHTLQSLWDYFVDIGAFDTRGQRAKIADQFAPYLPDVPPGFTRADFEQTLYVAHLQSWATLMQMTKGEG